MSTALKQSKLFIGLAAVCMCMACVFGMTQMAWAGGGPEYVVKPKQIWA